MGVNLAVIKTVVFGLSGAITGIGGALFGLKLGLVDADVPLFGLFGAITFLVAMVVGGAAQNWGPLVGAVFYVFVNEFARSVGERPKDFKWVFTLFSIVVVILALVLGVQWARRHRDQLTNLSSQSAAWVGGNFLVGVLTIGGLIFVVNAAGGVGDTKLDGLGGVIFGVLLILFARFAPYGAVGTFRLARSKVVQIVPKPPAGSKAVARAPRGQRTMSLPTRPTDLPIRIFSDYGHSRWVAANQAETGNSVTEDIYEDFYKGET